MPVARETAETPPRPIAALSAAATKRRDRSSKTPRTAANRCVIPVRSIILYQDTPKHFNMEMLFCRPNNEVIAWTPDSKRIVFLSRRNTFNTWFGRLFTVSVDGGLPEQLPIDKGGLLSFSADGTKMAYNRIFRNFRARKRYKGGMAQDIWIYDFKTNQDRADYPLPGYGHLSRCGAATSSTGCPTGDRSSARTSTAATSRRGQTRQLTDFKEFDVNWPSLGPDSIVFENGGWLYVFDLKTGKTRKLTVYLPGDLDTVRRRWAPVDKLITGFDIAPDGKQAVFTARGDVYTVPAKQGSHSQSHAHSGDPREVRRVVAGR